MSLLLLFSGFLFFAYILIITCIYKRVLPSISESWYLLQERKLGFIFTLWCFILSFLQIGFLIELAAEWYQFTGFLTAAGLAFVGAAPAFKGHERRIHRIGAGVAALFSILYTIFSGWSIIIGSFVFMYGIMFLMNYLTTKKVQNYIFWAEFYCFTSLFVTESILLWR